MADAWDQFIEANPIEVTRDDPWAAFKPTGERSGDTNTTPPPPEDPYRKAALAEYNRLLKAGVPVPGGGGGGPLDKFHDYSTRAARGGGFGWADELSSAALIPGAMIQHGTLDPTEAYKYNKAYKTVENEALDRSTAGFGGGLAEFAGNLGTGGALTSGTKAVAQTVPAALGFPAKTIPAGVANTSKNFLTGAGMGGVIGFGEGEGLKESAEKGVVGAGVGGTLGAALPVAFDYLVKPVARAFQMPRMQAPENRAIEQVNKAVRDSGLTTEEITQRIANAHAAGQTDYTVADAIGHAGHRKVAGIAKLPGEAREEITDFLSNRDLNATTRIRNEISKALGVQGTAKQAQEALIEEAGAAAGPYYRRAEHSGPVWNNAIQEILDTKAGKEGIKEGLVIQENLAAGSGKPFSPTDAAITGFNEAGDPIISGVPNTKTLHTLKVGLDRLIEQNTDDLGHVNAKGHSLIQMKNRLLENMDALNPDYKTARELYRGPMEVRSAVKTGQDMARTGRYEDNLQTFRGAPDPEKQGIRIGYADKVLEPLERSGIIPAQLREKSEKGANELAELSLYQGPRKAGQPDQLRQFLNREETMRKGSNAALGGSSTIENAADVAAGPGGTEVLGLASAALSGNPAAAASGIARFAHTLGSGESAAQRTAIARALMERDPEATRQLMERLDAYDLRRRGFNPWTGSVRINP
jgi:hypothetical protein